MSHWKVKLFQFLIKFFWTVFYPLPVLEKLIFSLISYPQTILKSWKDVLIYIISCAFRELIKI